MATLNYIWPIALIVLSNTVYQICSKSIPSGMNPFAALTVTYTVAALFSCVLYFALNKSGNLITEYKNVDWSPFVLGLVIVGLEAGFIYAYKAGWYVSSASIVQSTILAIVLIFVGFLLYHEALTWNKIVGIVICLIGIIFINWK